MHWLWLLAATAAAAAASAAAAALGCGMHPKTKMMRRLIATIVQKPGPFMGVDGGGSLI